MFCMRPLLARPGCRHFAPSPRPWGPARSVQSQSGRHKGYKSPNNTWTDEKLRGTDKYPLSLQLKENVRPAAEHVNRRQAYVRTTIVSPSLCDDVLKYVGSRLEPYKGCDILDIHPGAGLWSQKLHDFLKPRNHVLLEPSPEQYALFLDPLVNKEGSKYKLVSGETCIHQTYKDLLDSGVFPQQQPVDPSHPDARKLNNTLLVTGSLLWDPKLPGIGYDSMAKQLFIQFQQLSRSLDLFHKFGPVRTLLWVPSDEFRQMLPRAVWHVHKSSFYIDNLSHVEEIVTAPHSVRLAGRGNAGRGPQHEIESINRALKRGKENGHELPAHRREDIHDFAEDIARKTEGSRMMRTTEVYEYLKEQHYTGKSVVGMAADSSVHSWETDIAQEGLEKTLEPSGKRAGRRRVTPERMVANKRRSTANQNVANKVLCEETADIGEAIYHLECQVLEMKDDAQKEAAMAKLDQMEQEFEAALGKLNTNLKQSPSSEVDERLALQSPVPRLQWDNRLFEPLVMNSDEAWPVNRCSLVLCTPREPPEGYPVDWFEWVQDFASGLYMVTGISVLQALENMQPGASEIVSECPSLTDPKKGGRLNLNNLRVRMLTVEMVNELCKAYREWPFKPPDGDHKNYFRWKMGNKSEALI